MVAGKGRCELLGINNIDAHGLTSEITFSFLHMLILIACSLLLERLRAYARIILFIRRVYHLQLLHLLVPQDCVYAVCDVSAVLIVVSVLMNLRTGRWENKVLCVLIVLRNIALALMLVDEVIYDDIVVLRCLQRVQLRCLRLLSMNLLVMLLRVHLARLLHLHRVC